MTSKLIWHKNAWKKSDYELMCFKKQRGSDTVPNPNHKQKGFAFIRYCGAQSDRLPEELAGLVSEFCS